MGGYVVMLKERGGGANVEEKSWEESGYSDVVTKRDYSNFKRRFDDFHGNGFASTT